MFSDLCLITVHLLQTPIRANPGSSDTLYAYKHTLVDIDISNFKHIYILYIFKLNLLIRPLTSTMISLSYDLGFYSPMTTALRWLTDDDESDELLRDNGGRG